MGPWCSDTVIIFLGVSKDWSSLSTEKFEISMYFEYGLDDYLFWMMIEILLSRSQNFLECVSASNVFKLVMQVY